MAWKKVRGTKATWEKQGRWVSITKLRGKQIYVVHTTKNGLMDILGRSTKKTGATQLARQYMRTH